MVKYVTYNYSIHCLIFHKLHRLQLSSTQNSYICTNLQMLIAPLTGGQKRHFLRLEVLYLAGILTSCSTLDGRLFSAHRMKSSAYPDVHNARNRSWLLLALIILILILCTLIAFFSAFPCVKTHQFWHAHQVLCAILFYCSCVIIAPPTK